jgi:hypothetical protein
MKGRIIHVSTRENIIEVYFVDSEEVGMTMSFPFDSFEDKTTEEIEAYILKGVVRFLDMKTKTKTVAKHVDVATLKTRLTNKELV